MLSCNCASSNPKMADMPSPMLPMAVNEVTASVRSSILCDVLFTSSRDALNILTALSSSLYCLVSLSPCAAMDLNSLVSCLDAILALLNVLVTPPTTTSTCWKSSTADL